MKTRIFVSLAALCLAVAGCKSPQDKVMDLSNKYASAENVVGAECPLVPDAQGSFQQNNSPKCVEDRKRAEEIHQQLLDAQREAAK